VKIVCNSSVLITLDKAGILHILLDEIVSHGFRVADELYKELLMKSDEL